MALGHRHSNKGQQEHEYSANQRQNDGHHGDDVFNHIGGLGVVVVGVRSGHGVLSREDKKGNARILATEGKVLETHGPKAWAYFSKKVRQRVNQVRCWCVIDP